VFSCPYQQFYSSQDNEYPRETEARERQTLKYIKYRVLCACLIAAMIWMMPKQKLSTKIKTKKHMVVCLMLVVHLLFVDLLSTVDGLFVCLFVCLLACLFACLFVCL
jgi:hypothetical protein